MPVFVTGIAHSEVRDRKDRFHDTVILSYGFESVFDGFQSLSFHVLFADMMASYGISSCPFARRDYVRLG